LVVVNRTLSRAQELIESFKSGIAFNGQPSELEMLFGSNNNNNGNNKRLVLVVSTLPPTAQYIFQPQELLTRFKPIVFDAAYRPRNTPLLIQANQLGCPIIQGIDMLIAQGLEQARIWESQSLQQELRRAVHLNEEKIQQIQQAVFTFYDR
jgi:shikimate 5-dehydrogenase